HSRYGRLRSPAERMRGRWTRSRLRTPRRGSSPTRRLRRAGLCRWPRKRTSLRWRTASGSGSRCTKRIGRFATSEAPRSEKDDLRRSATAWSLATKGSISPRRSLDRHFFFGFHLGIEQAELDGKPADRCRGPPRETLKSSDGFRPLPGVLVHNERNRRAVAFG